MIRQAVILAGGRGARLGSLTEHMPKPALDVGGCPFIRHIILRLKRCGVREFVVSVGHLASHMRSALAGESATINLIFSEEISPLGTGGGLRHSKGLLQDTFFVLNGDSLFEFDYQDLGGLLDDATDISIALRPSDNVSRYGVVNLAGTRVTSFSEKHGSGPGLINGGVYAMTSKVFEAIPEGHCSLEHDVFPALASARRIAGRAYDGFFVDIGTPLSLEEARRSVPFRKLWSNP